MDGPTVYPELNRVLAELVERLHEILGDGFVGAYLLGSFALGDADEHADVDFLVVAEDDVADDQLAGLQALHARLHALKTPWAQHLEGSYVPRQLLRRVDPARTPLLFLDNGARELVRDPHCNTAVVRWTLRERGVVLAGPKPSTLVEEVTHEELRAEMYWMLREYAEWAREPTEAGPMNRWKQPYLVLTMCRIAHTAATGTVASKREAATWAMRELDPAWSGLIQGALEDRADPWNRFYQPGDTELVERTLAFVDYVAHSKSHQPA